MQHSLGSRRGRPSHSCNLLALFLHTSRPTFATAYFVGGGPQVLSLDVVHTASERSYLRTQAMGTVVLELGIISRNFEKFGVVSYSFRIVMCLFK
jgi:hypothetical protein